MTPGLQQSLGVGVNLIINPFHEVAFGGHRLFPSVVNGLEAPMDDTDYAVLGSIERDLLRLEVVERAIEFAIDDMRPDGDDARRANILAEMHRLDEELSRLTAAIATGGDLPALLAALKERQAQHERYERALIELDVTSRIGRSELPRLERDIRHRLADWRAMLRREVPEAREILRDLVVSRIVFKPRPEARVYEFSGRGSFGRLLAGTTTPVSVLTPAGHTGPLTPARACLLLASICPSDGSRFAPLPRNGSRTHVSRPSPRVPRRRRASPLTRPALRQDIALASLGEDSE